MNNERGVDLGESSEPSLEVSLDVRQSDDQLEGLVDTEEDDEADTITPAQLVAEITLAWHNEICSPRLLPHKETLVDLMVDQLEAMEENFSLCSDQTALKIILHKMEVQRLAYITNEYIRERLKKIEKDVEMLLNESTEREKTNSPALLSTVEKGFAERFGKMKRHLMEACFLERIPPALQRFPTATLDMSNERVIIEVTSGKMEHVAVHEMADLMSEQTIDLEPGSIHLVPFPSISDLLENNKVYFDLLSSIEISTDAANRSKLL